MSIKIHLHKSHRPLAGGRETVEVRGKTVGECIRDLFGRHKSATDVAKALAVLLDYGSARREQESTRGRSAERWHAVDASMS